MNTYLRRAIAAAASAAAAFAIASLLLDLDNPIQMAVGLVISFGIGGTAAALVGRATARRVSQPPRSR